MQAAVPCAEAGREGARLEKFPRSRAGGRDWPSSGVRVEVVCLGHWSSLRAVQHLPCPPLVCYAVPALPWLPPPVSAAYAFLARGYLRTSAPGGSDRGTEQGCSHRNPLPYPNHRRGPFISHAHYTTLDPLARGSTLHVALNHLRCFRLHSRSLPLSLSLSTAKQRHWPAAIAPHSSKLK
jgi:hypothetical protein